MSFVKQIRELWDHLRGKGPAAAVAITLDLGTARDNKPYFLEAGGVIVETCTGDLYARVNGPNGDGINLRYVNKILFPVTSLYLTNAAQSGRSARLLLVPAGMESDPSVVTVVPSGDMARREWFDRNPSVVFRSAGGSFGAHGETDRWSYTVPAGKKAMHTILYEYVYPSIATSDRFACSRHWLNIGGSGYSIMAQIVQYYGAPYLMDQTITASFMLAAGDIIKLTTYNDDTINHAFFGSSVLVEFNA